MAPAGHCWSHPLAHHSLLPKLRKQRKQAFAGRNLCPPGEKAPHYSFQIGGSKPQKLKFHVRNWLRCIFRSTHLDQQSAQGNPQQPALISANQTWHQWARVHSIPPHLEGRMQMGPEGWNIHFRTKVYKLFQATEEKNQSLWGSVEGDRHITEMHQLWEKHLHHCEMRVTRRSERWLWEQHLLRTTRQVY